MMVDEFTDEILTYGVRLNNGYSIKPFSHGDKCDYSLFKNNKRINFIKNAPLPSSLSNRSKLGKFISKNTSGDEERENTIADLEDLLIKFYDIKKEREKSKFDEEMTKKRNAIDESLSFYKKLTNPIVWIGSNVDWIVAGERTNVLITTLCCISQIVLHKPISVIGQGVGSSGKTYIMNNTLKMMPEEYIIKEKKPTLASMFRRSTDDPWYYHDKIVYYGDMGGENDQSETEDTLNLLKELQTDGDLNRPVTKKKEGGDFDIVDLELHGTPALFYTTTPDAGNNRANDDESMFDSQSLSRSIIYKPRVDNKRIFNNMTTHLEFGGHTAMKQEEIMDRLFSIMPNVVLGLREIFDGIRYEDEDKRKKTLDFKPEIKIINPYHRVIVKFLGNSEYYKRDSTKYENLLKAITCLNYFNHEVIEMGGQKVMFVTFDDIKLFLSLMGFYQVSANLNITPTQESILADIYAQYKLYEEEGIKGFLQSPYNDYYSDDEGEGYYDDEGVYDDEQETLDEELGVSVLNFLKFNSGKYSRKTLYRAFNTFEEKGICYVIGKDNLARKIYKFSYSHQGDTKDLEKELVIKDNDIKLFEEEYPTHVIDFLMNDQLHPNISVYNQYGGVEEPVWNKEKVI